MILEMEIVFMRFAGVYSLRPHCSNLFFPAFLTVIGALAYFVRGWVGNPPAKSGIGMPRGGLFATFVVPTVVLWLVFLSMYPIPQGCPAKAYSFFDSMIHGSTDAPPPASPWPR